MSVQIHPSSVVSPEARLGEDVVIGPFCLIEGNAVIGARTQLRSHVVIGPHTELGEDNDIYPHATLGMGPQDLKFKGAPTRLKAHDCHVGTKNIFANCATLAGHVEVGDGCNIGAFSAVHQFCRVGDHAFMGGFTVATQDVLPFMKTVGARDTKSYGVNTIGLQRKGFPLDVVEGLKKAHRLLFHAGLLREEAMAQAERELGHIPEVAYLLRFIREAKRGVHRG